MEISIIGKLRFAVVHIIVVPNFYVADSKIVKSNNVGAMTLGRTTITIMAINIILNRDRNSTFLYKQQIWCNDTW
jgi:hypothetical protein